MITPNSSRRNPATVQAMLNQLPPSHRRVLTDGLRAPSAHNAQPWRLEWVSAPDSRDELVDPAAAQWFALHYDHNDYLPHDPDDRDAFLCMGALVETIVLAGVRHQVSVDVVDVFERSGSDLHVLDVVLRATPESFSEVERRWAELASDRHTNRSKYTAEALPVELTDELTSLGCSFVSPDQLSDLVDEASKLSWNDRRFVADLERYCHSEVSAPRGMTANGLMLTRYEWAFLQGAFSLGKLPGWLGRVFSARDVRLMRTAPAVAVLGADSLNPKDLVEAGRRLLRCWSLVSGTGWAYHPISISVDRPETAPRVAALSGIPVPAAVFRIGRPSAPASRSNRVQLIDVFQE